MFTARRRVGQGIIYNLLMSRFRISGIVEKADPELAIS